MKLTLKWTMTMPITTVRRLILAALILVVLTQMVYWVIDAWEGIGLIIWGIAAAVATFFLRAKAGKAVQANKQYYVWMAVAAIVAAIPIVHRLYKVFNDETAWGQRIWQMAPVFISFIIPVILLWLAYTGLAGHLGPLPQKNDKK